MLFNVERDTGPTIAGYLIPDTFSGTGEIVVQRGNDELLRMPAGDFRPGLVQAGRHETGHVGFEIDEAAIPGLSQINDLDIREAETGLLIYRRVSDPDKLIQRKVFRLETQLLPLVRLDRALQQRFRFQYTNIERFGFETNCQMFLMSPPESTFISGRIEYKRLEQYLASGFYKIMLMRDPFEELAERILVLRQIAQMGGNILGERDSLLFEEAVAFACDLPLDTEKQINRAFKAISPEAASVLGNPLIRQLTTRLPSDAVKTTSVSAALDVLADFDLVGLRSEPDLFVDTLTDALSLDRGALPSLDPLPVSRRLGDELRECPPAEMLLELDLQLYVEVKAAFQKFPSLAGS
ncbi:hypothetical protein [uncultured Enterovirga sp.]|uniref:hypothetical protein n=1 Tax=uncultured Enterovirga sp. TaxID=2026352 RepID=UPI0035CB7907